MPESDQGKSRRSEIDLLAFPRFISYAHCVWLLLYNRYSDVNDTTSHRTISDGRGERGSEGAANDLDRLRIRLTDSLKNERRLALTWKLLILERDIIKVLFFVIVKNISLT